MSEPTWDFRMYQVEPEEGPPMPPVGTPVYGETTDGEPFTLYVVESTTEGIRIGAEKP